MYIASQIDNFPNKERSEQDLRGQLAFSNITGIISLGIVNPCRCSQNELESDKKCLTI
jgi:hypothetical protein